MKESMYNFIYDDFREDDIIFYNSFSGALATINSEQYGQYCNFVRDGKEITDKKFLFQLQKCGFLIPKDINEIYLVKTRMLQGRYNSKVLGLTIAPTMACNFRCIYCFEQGHYGNKMMSEETMNNLVKFVNKNIKGVERLNITWFGGEPLLGLPVIERLSNKFIEICNENNIEYSASIITNGYLLTKDVVESLKDLKVKFIQITVDGPKEIHDVRRPLINGDGTFDTIFRNLEECKGILPISLRINVDIENMNLADKVYGILEEKDLVKDIYPYLGLVVPYNDIYDENKCITDQQYASFNHEFMLKHNISLKSKYPKQKRNHCVADLYKGWVIDDNGKMYKCWNDIGNQVKVVGDINTNTNYLKNTYYLMKYSEFDPMTNLECRECKMLPICMGGCPNNRLNGKNYCDSRRHVFKKFLMDYTRTLLG